MTPIGSMAIVTIHPSIRSRAIITIHSIKALISIPASRVCVIVLEVHGVGSGPTASAELGRLRLGRQRASATRDPTRPVRTTESGATGRGAAGHGEVGGRGRPELPAAVARPAIGWRGLVGGPSSGGGKQDPLSRSQVLTLLETPGGRKVKKGAPKPD